MTTKNSSRKKLIIQAQRMAMVLKNAEQGRFPDNDPAGKMKAARETPEVKFAVVMDDKILTISMTWEVIKATSHNGIVEYIRSVMAEERNTPN